MATKRAGEAGWYYGTGGYDGEPDATDARWCISRAEAEGTIGINYDVEGPFDSSDEADASLAAWFKAVMEEDASAPVGTNGKA